jgi:hypothetical protein
MFCDVDFELTDLTGATKDSQLLSDGPAEILSCIFGETDGKECGSGNSREAVPNYGQRVCRRLQAYETGSTSMLSSQEMKSS